MRLKELELHGFKSFARKTKIRFDDQYSVIVGPNGCGKSNISDAIRWVLGEQSAKNLRGSKMEDVVFAGSADLKPMNYCKVSITFDNYDKSLPIDYEEVVVSRIVYRTGESKYQINKSNVRLKDVRELFMDTGLGKEGYSIISQGRIDEILSSKPEERRVLLDEAAGVSKYKYKRDESLKRLTNTLENLSRVEDIMQEADKTRLYLKKEAEKAEKALGLKKELELKELAHFKQISSEISKDMDELKDEFDQEKNKLKEVKSSFEKNKKSLEDAKIKLNFLEVDEQNKKIEYKNIESTYNEVSTNLKIDTQKLISFKKDIERIIEDIASQNIKLASLNEKEKKENKDLELENNNLALLNEKSLQINGDIRLLKTELLKLNESVEDAKSNLNFHKEKQNQYDLTLMTNDNLAKNYQIEFESLTMDMDLHTNNQEALIKEIREKDLNAKALISDITKLEDGRDKIKELVQQLEESLDKQVDELKTITNQLSHLESNLSLLMNLNDNYEGFYKPVQNFLKISRDNKEIRSRYINPLADEIRVKDGFEKAIEYALGGQLQNIITRTMEDTEILINYLKSNNIGRLTFLPLERFFSGKKDKLGLFESDYIEFASDVVKCKNEIKPLIDSLLGRTIIVDSMQKARSLANKTKNRIVTLDGDIINTSGSIVGGSNKFGSYNLLNRKKEIKNLKTDIENINNKILNLNKIIDKSKLDLEKEIKSLEEINQNIKKKTEVRNTLMGELNQLKLEEALLLNEVSKTKDKIDDIRKKIASFTSFDQNEIEETKKEVIDLVSEISMLEKKSEKKNSILVDLEKESFINKNKIDSSERDIRVFSNNVSSIKNEIIEGNKNLIRLEGDYESSKLLYESTQTKIAEYEKTLNIYEELVEKYEDDLLDLEARVKEGRNELTMLNDLNLALANESSKLELSISRKESFYNNLYEKLSFHKISLMEDYGYSSDELQIKLDSLEELFVDEDELKKIKKSYMKISNYNEAAIEEYKAIKSDYEFYMNQKDDLLNSKADVEEVISSLEVQILDEFNTSFKEINSRFDRIFSTLFEGGSARLILDNNTDLSGGVDIEAKLPGKNMQNLSLLSGGERALIAVSLLFAIFETNPAPFCILDEADAALDEANINRYVEYLKSFDDIQFIMITHRKTTMVIANTMYGVTMEEEGISKVLRLELGEYDN